MKRPSFQFYPSDWLRDPNLRRCSLEARGLWIELLCHMHEGEPYGHFQFTDDVINREDLPKVIARILGEDIRRIRRNLQELISNKVCSFAPNGCLYSRRQVRDNLLREKRGQHGEKSQQHPNVPPPKRLTDGYHQGIHDGPPVRSPSADPSGVSIGGSPSSSSSLSSSDLKKEKKLREPVDTVETVERNASARRKSASPSPLSPLGLAQEGRPDDEEPGQDADRSIGTDTGEDIEELIKTIGMRMTMPGKPM